MGAGLCALGPGQVAIKANDPVENHIAWIFMQYGEWKEIGPARLLEGNQLKAIELRWVPVEQANEGFEIIGNLSQIFAGYDERLTVEARAVVQILAPPRPKWFAPLVMPDYKGKALPLWRFVQAPNFTVPRKKWM